jgi:hypothetical protein
MVGADEGELVGAVLVAEVVNQSSSTRGWKPKYSM